MSIVALMISLVFATNQIEYRFGMNFGTKFKDFSGNGRDGLSTGVLCTDRGVYFGGLSKGITITSFTIPSSVTIIIWILTKGDGQIYYHGTVPTSYLTLYKDIKTLSCKNSAITSGNPCSIGNAINKNIWVLSVVKKNSNKYSLDSTSASSSTDFTFNDDFTSIGLGGNSKSKSFTGFIWYFLMTTTPYLRANFIVSTTTYTSIGTANNCEPKFQDPDYGPICISSQIDPGRDSFSKECTPAGTTCSGTFIYSCTCADYCLYNIQTKIDSCSTTSTITTCNSPLVSRQGACCNDKCGSCSDSSTCLTCIDPNGRVNSGTCECGSGYFGQVSSDTTTTCQACLDNCDACPDLMSCSTCKETFIKVSGKCVCPTGTYLDDSSILIQTCNDCAVGCTNCSKSECFDCNDDNSVIDGFYCSCKTGFYSAGNSTFFYCALCSGECSDCNSTTWCFDCKDSFAESVGGVCECVDKYEGTPGTGTGPGCTPICEIGCSTCSTPTVCQTCVDDNAIVDGSSCKCVDGFYWLPSGIIFCHSCLDFCLTCDQPDNCTSCMDSLSTLKEGICVCNDGYYGEPEGRSGSGGCLKCPSECSLCTSLNNCLSCIDENAHIKDGLCKCKEGYYQNETSLIQSCIQCSDECKSCESNNACLTCKSLNTFISDSGNCECNQGYYNLSALILSGSCIECDSLCAICTDIDNCIECKGNFTEEVSSRCTCKPGYYKPSIKSTDCSKCTSSSKSKQCKTECPSKTVEINGLCETCPDLCEVCESSIKCIECQSPFLLNSGLCGCPKGEIVSNSSCEAKYFKSYLNVNSDNSITVYFTEETEVLLKSDNFTVHYRGKVRKIDLVADSYSAYQIEVLETEFIINFGFSLSLNGEIFSNEGSQLENYKLTGKFNAPIGPLVESVKTTVKVAVSASFAAAMVSNPAACWVLINTIQIITYMPLANLDFSPSLLQFLQATSTNSIMPNIMQDVFDSDSSSTPIEREQRSGIESSVLWINIGPNILLFIIYIT